MDKSFMIFVAVGIGFYYLITNFVGDMEKDDGYPTTTMEQEAHKYDQYFSQDSIGREVIVADGVDRKTQLEAWRHSEVRDDFLSFYPQFDEMEKVIKERVNTKDLQEYLLDKTKKIERQFLEGSINDEQAQRALKKL
jgi:hypothetical protein